MRKKWEERSEGISEYFQTCNCLLEEKDEGMD